MDSSDEVEPGLDRRTLQRLPALMVVSAENSPYRCFHPGPAGVSLDDRPIQRQPLLTAGLQIER